MLMEENQQSIYNTKIMAKKKIDNRKLIIDAYTHYVLRNGNTPGSVFLFAEENNLTETDFYNHFGSFEAIEKTIFKLFFDNTLDLLKKNKEYKAFDAKNKLLSFYYTFFEVLKANRSFVRYSLENNKNRLGALTLLSDLRSNFQKYVDDLDINTLDLQSDKLTKIKDKGVKEIVWSQLLLTIKFWLDDHSADFEKTDLFIEKSINAGFDILDITPLKSVVDFGKFLFKEKINPIA